MAQITVDTDLNPAKVEKIMKKIEQDLVTGCGRAASYKKERNKQKIKSNVKMLADTTKSSVTSITSNFENSLKGQWGKKAKEAFAKNENKLNSF